MTWRILLVDGREGERATVRAALTRAGVRTLHEEGDPAQAVERSRSVAYDAVIVGCEVAGAVPELIRALRADVIAPPILALVERNDEAFEQELVEAGASDIMTRSDLTLARLIRRLRHTIRVAREIELRDEILAIVSHDLRNPITAISVATDELEDAALDRVSRQKLTGAIRRAVLRADRLISDLLDVSRIESGGLRLELRPVGVEALLARAKRDHELLAREAGLSIDVEIAAGVGHVLADGDRVPQVLGNLIANALRHGKGTITLRADLADEQVRMWVIDRGTGIPAEQLPRVFDRFWQAKHHGRAGAGLGLAIAKGIVEAHGGSIGVRSDPGEGTRFWFCLRRSEPEPP